MSCFRIWLETVRNQPNHSQPSGNVSTAGSLGWRGSATAARPAQASPLVPSDARATTPEASLKCRSCRKGRFAPPVRMIKLTERQEITPYKWVHPDDER